MQTRVQTSVCIGPDDDFTKLNRARINKGTPQRKAAVEPRVSAVKGSGGAKKKGLRNAAIVLLMILVRSV
jgi:hypothetical protein